MKLIKNLWYFSFWIFVRLALKVYFRDIKMSGKENLPKNAPVIFGANHENALIDPLIMTTRLPWMIHYLVRADVFSNPLVKAFLNSLNLMPVYRISDGVNSVKANEKIFNDCFKVFAKGEHLILFPEATHDPSRIVKKAKKGIARIAIGAMNYVDAPKELYIVPTGMNYSRHSYFRSSVHIIFGQPIKIESQELTSDNIDDIKDRYDAGLQEVSVSLPKADFEIFDTIFFHDQHPGIPLDPIDINTQVSEISQYITEEQKENILATKKELTKSGLHFPFEYRTNYWLHGILSVLMVPIGALGAMIHSVPLLAMTRIMKGFKDKVWKDTIHFAVGMVLVPFCWLVVGLVVANVLGQAYFGLMAAVACFLSFIFMKTMTRHWTLFVTNRSLRRNKAMHESYLKFVGLIDQFRS